jgi:hypothetical protein
MNDPRQDLEAACKELVRRKKEKEIPDRQLVRLAFLSLGKVALDEGESEAVLLAGLLREAAAPHEDRWHEAVESEMTLAVTEFVSCVDPNFLDKPIYDFEYTVAARERLEARLWAADAIGTHLPEGLLDQVLQADEMLAPYLEDRGKAD